MGRIWGMSRGLLHARPEVLQLAWGLGVHPFARTWASMVKSLCPICLGDRRKVTTRYKAPAGVGVAGLVGPIQSGCAKHSCFFNERDDVVEALSSFLRPRPRVRSCQSGPTRAAGPFEMFSPKALWRARYLTPAAACASAGNAPPHQATHRATMRSPTGSPARASIPRPPRTEN